MLSVRCLVLKELMGPCYGQNHNKHKYLHENLGGYVVQTGPERKVVKSHPKDTVLEYC